MSALSDEVKSFIVEELARFEKPQRVADAVKEEFGIVIVRQHVEHYDPEKKCKTKKWVELHKVARQMFLEGQVTTAIERRGWRLRMIERMALRAERAKNYKLAAELLEQAAKEEGGAYRGGGARVGVPAAAADSDEDRATRIMATLDAMDAATAPPPPVPTGPQLVKQGGAGAASKVANA